jgi:6-pyruvoyltetrahydropterin/6-carboxytetrahydropterin synthase
MREEVVAQMQQPDRIDPHQTPGCGAVLCCGDEGPALPM